MKKRRLGAPLGEKSSILRQRLKNCTESIRLVKFMQVPPMRPEAFTTVAISFQATAETTNGVITAKAPLRRPIGPREEVDSFANESFNSHLETDFFLEFPDQSGSIVFTHIETAAGHIEKSPAT